MKFRKRPVVVEADQFKTGEPVPKGVEFRWYSEHHESAIYSDSSPLAPYTVVVRTLEGDMQVSEGDWIITGVDGERYPCKPDIFEKTYEKVED